MNGARFVHDQLELAGWPVAIADAQQVKAWPRWPPKPDRIDVWVLLRAVPPRPGPRDLAAHPQIRAERERPRWRLHLVRHRTALKNRIHATLLAFGKPCPVSDLVGAGGRQLLARLALPEHGPGTWSRRWPHRRPGRPGRRRRTGPSSPRRRPPLWAAAHDRPRDRLGAWLHIAAELGDITRFPSPKKLGGDTGLRPRVDQSGGPRPARPDAKNGPPYQRWVLIEAAIHAATIPATATTISPPSSGLVASAAPGSPGLRLPASSPRPSGTCSPAPSPLLRQGPYQRSGRLTTPPALDQPEPPLDLLLPIQEAIARCALLVGQATGPDP